MLGTWTVNGGGHCVEHRLVSYSPGPLNGGDLFQWLASSRLCDQPGAPGVAGLWLKASVDVPKNLKWHCPRSNSVSYSGGTSTRAVDPSTTGAAVSYFEAGDGVTPPPVPRAQPTGGHRRC